MPFVALNKNTKKFGIQTYQRVLKLAPELRDQEMEYLDMRDWYLNQRAVLAQFEEALEQARARNNKDEIAEFEKRINREKGKLKDVRQRARELGEKSWAEAFYLAADHMLSKENRMVIAQQADALIGRARHELVD